MTRCRALEESHLLELGALRYSKQTLRGLRTGDQKEETSAVRVYEADHCQVNVPQKFWRSADVNLRAKCVKMQKIFIFTC